MSISCCWKAKKALFHSQFQKTELPLSRIRILEEPLAALSGPLWDCRSDSSGERKSLCSEFQTPALEKALSVYQQSQTDWMDFYISINNHKRCSSPKIYIVGIGFTLIRAYRVGEIFCTSTIIIIIVCVNIFLVSFRGFNESQRCRHESIRC